MEEIISKELLSEVLDIEATGVNQEIDKNSYLDYHYKETFNNSKGFVEVGRSISIHELAHKCKEWSRKDFVNCLFSMDIHIHYDGYMVKTTKFTDIDEPVHIQFKECTEPEAIFKACQWIYNETQ